MLLLGMMCTMDSTSVEEPVKFARFHIIKANTLLSNAVLHQV